MDICLIRLGTILEAQVKAQIEADTMEECC